MNSQSKSIPTSKAKTPPPPSRSSPRSPSSKSVSLYDQWNYQLSLEIEEEEEEEEEEEVQTQITTTRSRPTNKDNNNNRSYGIMSYFLGSSSLLAANSNTGAEKEWGKTKVSVSIIGDAFVDLFCYLNSNGSNGHGNGNGLPELGADVRINQPGKFKKSRVFSFLFCGLTILTTDN